MPWRRSACRWRTGTCSNTYGQHVPKSLQMLSHRNLQEASRRCLLQTTGCLFLWSITSGWPNNEILDHSCYFVLLKLEDISKQNQYLYYRYIILLISALVCSHTKFNMWFQEHLQGGHCVPCKLFPLIFQPHQCSWRSTPWSSPAPHH